MATESLKASFARVPWIEVLLFISIATLVSAPFRLGYVPLPSGDTIPWGLEIFFRMLRGIGPAVGYLFMRSVWRTAVPRTTSFWGFSPVASAIAASTIPIGLGMVGVQNANGLSEHYFGVLTGLMLCGYALGEEYGWRGYLQPALAALPVAVRVLAIATIWYLWHLNFLNPNIPLTAHFIHFAGLVGGAWGLLKVTEVTGSILFAAAVHLSFNVLFDVDATTAAKIGVLVLAITVWTALIVRVSRYRSAAATSAASDGPNLPNSGVN